MTPSQQRAPAFQEMSGAAIPTAGPSLQQVHTLLYARTFPCTGILHPVQRKPMRWRHAGLICLDLTYIAVAQQAPKLATGKTEFRWKHTPKYSGVCQMQVLMKAALLGSGTSLESSSSAQVQAPRTAAQEALQDQVKQRQILEHT
jgi:hypothetical protein